MQHKTYSDVYYRYSGKEMLRLFSDDEKYQMWRKCWIALAEAQKELGLDKIISSEAINQMKQNQKKINYEDVFDIEKQTKHDVMAHILSFAKQCPKAQKIIHLGATSQFVGCNTDLIMQKKALTIVKKKLINIINNLQILSKKYKDLPCLGYTHLQIAQPTTIGKRITIYIADLLMDLEFLEFVENKIKARGAKGTVGTQASYLELFGGDAKKTKQLDKLVAKKLGFDDVFEVCTQTYSRKLDTKIAEVLAGIAGSSYKFAGDLRIAANFKIMEEPFTKNQIGSSAMPYKRNPMHSERICSLARKLMTMPLNFHLTHSNQWFERTLDDSAIRRIDIPQMFLLADGILLLYENISSDLVVYPAQIKKQLDNELPFLAIELILMKCVKKGKSRQKMHKLLKNHCLKVANNIKQNARENDLIDRIAKDNEIPLSKKELNEILKNPIKFTGLAKEQTEDFLANAVKPVIEKYKDLIDEKNHKNLLNI